MVAKKRSKKVEKKPIRKPAKSAKKKPLSARQRAFAAEFLVDKNAVNAYRRAGYKDTPSIEHNATRMMENDGVRELIEKGLADQAQRTQVTTDLVVTETLDAYFLAKKAEKYAACASLLTLLGKHTGAFPNTLIHAGDKNEPIRIKFVEFARADPRPAPAG